MVKRPVPVEKAQRWEDTRLVAPASAGASGVLFALILGALLVWSFIHNQFFG